MGRYWYKVCEVCSLCGDIEGLPEIKKNFYVEDPQVSQLTPQEVDQIRYTVHKICKQYTHTCTHTPTYGVNNCYIDFQG